MASLLSKQTASSKAAAAALALTSSFFTVYLDVSNRFVGTLGADLTNGLAQSFLEQSFSSSNVFGIQVKSVCS